MRHASCPNHPFAALLLALTVGLSVADLDACGDKFHRVGRGAGFWRVYAALHPATILIYIDPQSPLAEAARRLKLENALTKAGHRPSMVNDTAALNSALRSVKYDVVLADIAEVPGIRTRVEPAGPEVVPLVYNPTKADLAAAKDQYGCFLRIPGKAYEVLEEIDHVMELRRAGRKPKP